MNNRSYISNGVIIAGMNGMMITIYAMILLMYSVMMLLAGRYEISGAGGIWLLECLILFPLGYMSYQHPDLDKVMLASGVSLLCLIVNVLVWTNVMFVAMGLIGGLIVFSAVKIICMKFKV